MEKSNTKLGVFIQIETIVDFDHIFYFDFKYKIEKFFLLVIKTVK